MSKANITTLVNQLDKKSGRLVATETMVYVTLVAVSILFLFLAGIFLQVASIQKFTVPAELSLSSVCVLISAILTIKLRRLKKEDKLKPFRVVITAITASGLLFFICQFIGWQKMLGYLPSGQKNLVVILVVAHALHFLIAFGLGVYMLVKSYTIKSGADLYIYFLGFSKQLFFKLTFIYWDFLSYLWIILFIIIQVKSMYNGV